jgi:hypothetical protein
VTPHARPDRDIAPVAATELAAIERDALLGRPTQSPGRSTDDIETKSLERKAA